MYPLSPQTAGLRDLQRIFLSSCSLTAIHPDALANLTNLVELDVSANLLLEVPTQAFRSCLPEAPKLMYCYALFFS